MKRNLASGGSGAPKIIEVMYRIYQLVVLVIVRVLTVLKEISIRDFPNRTYKRCGEKCSEISSLRTLLNKPDSFLDALDASESAAAFLRVST